MNHPVVFLPHRQGLAEASPGADVGVLLKAGDCRKGSLKKPREKRTRNYEAIKAVHERVAELLLHNKHEADNKNMERMAEKTPPAIYLETMEEAEDKENKSQTAGDS